MKAVYLEVTREGAVASLLAVSTSTNEISPTPHNSMTDLKTV